MIGYLIRLFFFLSSRASFKGFFFFYFSPIESNHSKEQEISSIHYTSSLNQGRYYFIVDHYIIR